MNWRDGEVGALWRGESKTYALNDGHEVVWIGLWEATSRVHFMYKEGNIASAEFLDEKMRKKVIIACKVEHVHDFGGAPFCSDRLFVSRGHRGWL